MGLDAFTTHFKTLERWSDSALGIAACHLPSLTTVEYNAHREFDLCSTYKIPIAVCLLQKVEANALDLNRIIEITEYDLRRGMTSTLNQFQYSVPVNISVLNLLQLMMQESCNSATDIILDLVGGTNAVQATLRNAGIDKLRVDRTILEYLAELNGVYPIPDKKCTIREFEALANQVSIEAKELAQEKQRENLRDHGQVKSMNQLLIKIHQHEILSEGHAQLLLKIMQRCKTGSQRIMGMLPPNTRLAHKTGTDDHYAHDVGIIYLPETKGAIALSVFVETGKPKHIAEQVIADVARSLYDFFIFCAF